MENIIALLQAALALLSLLQSTPNASPELRSQVMGFASRAVQMATEQITHPIPSPYHPIPTNNLGSPPLSINPPQPIMPPQNPTTSAQPESASIPAPAPTSSPAAPAPIPQPRIEFFDQNFPANFPRFRDDLTADPKVGIPGYSWKDENEVAIYIRLYNADGSTNSSADMTMSINPDDGLNTSTNGQYTRRGTGAFFYNNPRKDQEDGFYAYAFTYAFTKPGDHVFTFSALGVSKSLTITVK